MRKYAAQYELDRRLEAAYLNYDNGFFIEAGAADGTSQSNTYYFAAHRGWRGVLVEPAEQLYQRCCSARPESFVFRGALVSEANRHLKTITLSYCGLMTVVKGVFGDKEMEAQYIATGEKSQHLQAYEFSAPAATLNSILKQAESRFNPLPRINFLSLDIEGYEYEAIQGLDLKTYCPDYILVEYHYRDIEAFEQYIQPTHIFWEKLTDRNYLYKSRVLKSG